MAQNGQKNGQNSTNLLASFVCLETTQQNGTSRFHTIFKDLGQKWAKKCKKICQNSKYLLSSFFWLETTPENVTSRFQSMFGSRDTNFQPFLAKIGIFGSKFQPNRNLYS